MIKTNYLIDEAPRHAGESSSIKSLYYSSLIINNHYEFFIVCLPYFPDIHIYICNLSVRVEQFSSPKILPFPTPRASLLRMGVEGGGRVLNMDVNNIP